jgi:hypothetical protein
LDSEQHLQRRPHQRQLSVSARQQPLQRHPSALAQQLLPLHRPLALGRLLPRNRLHLALGKRQLAQQRPPSILEEEQAPRKRLHSLATPEPRHSEVAEEASEQREALQHSVNRLPSQALDSQYSSNNNNNNCNSSSNNFSLPAMKSFNRPSSMFLFMAMNATWCSLAGIICSLSLASEKQCTLNRSHLLM